MEYLVRITKFRFNSERCIAKLQQPRFRFINDLIVHWSNQVAVNAILKLPLLEKLSVGWLPNFTLENIREIGIECVSGVDDAGISELLLLTKINMSHNTKLQI